MYSINAGTTPTGVEKVALVFGLGLNEAGEAFKGGKATVRRSGAALGEDLLVFDDGERDGDDLRGGWRNDSAVYRTGVTVRAFEVVDGRVLRAADVDAEDAADFARPFVRVEEAEAEVLRRLVERDRDERIGQRRT